MVLYWASKKRLNKLTSIQRRKVDCQLECHDSVGTVTGKTLALYQTDCEMHMQV